MTQTRTGKGGAVRGFTLIELVVVIAIIMLLASILVPVTMGAIRRGNEAQCTAQLSEIGRALAAYRQDVGRYPDPFASPVMPALVHGKYLPEVRTCPLDPKKNTGDDSYGPLYNYLGYKINATPTLTNAGDYPTGPVSALVNARNKTIAMAREVYLPYQQVTPAGDAYYWRGGTVGAFPQTNADLKSQGAMFGSPDTEFPGLINTDPPVNTIMTICPYHYTKDHSYNVLRVDGSVAMLKGTDRLNPGPPVSDTAVPTDPTNPGVTYSQQFWTFSREPKL